MHRATDIYGICYKLILPLCFCFLCLVVHLTCVTPQVIFAVGGCGDTWINILRYMRAEVFRGSVLIPATLFEFIKKNMGGEMERHVIKKIQQNFSGRI